jgi:hypothetical protein
MVPSGAMEPPGGGMLGVVLGTAATGALATVGEAAGGVSLSVPSSEIITAPAVAGDATLDVVGRRGAPVTTGAGAKLCDGVPGNGDSSGAPTGRATVAPPGIACSASGAAGRICSCELPTPEAVPMRT